MTKAYANAYSTWKLLDIASSLQCADKKDKVYGIISIVSWGNVATLTPDYTQTEFKIAVSFIHALSRLEDASREDTCLQDASFLTAGNLYLNTRSSGVSDALGARSCDPDIAIVQTKIQFNAPWFSSSRYALGWCLSNDCLDQSRPDYSIWSPTGHENHIYLPRWARPGDWVIQLRGYAFGWFGECDCPVLIVKREMANIRRGPLIGRGFGSMDGTALASTEFQIHWDAEDLVLCLTANDARTMGRRSDDWLGCFLNVGICKQQTPGSTLMR